MNVKMGKLAATLMQNATTLLEVLLVNVELAIKGMEWTNVKVCYIASDSMTKFFLTLIMCDSLISKMLS